MFFLTPSLLACVFFLLARNSWSQLCSTTGVCSYWFLTGGCWQKWSFHRESAKTQSSLSRKTLTSIMVYTFEIFKKHFIHLFIERGEGREKREKETSMWGCLLCTPSWGPSPKPRHAPWLGIKPQPFDLQVSTHSTEPHHPGHIWSLLNHYSVLHS